jgi:hypothetical protein
VWYIPTTSISFINWDIVTIKSQQKSHPSLLPPSILEGNEFQGEERKASIFGSPWAHQINSIICPDKYET